MSKVEKKIKEGKTNSYKIFKWNHFSQRNEKSCYFMSMFEFQPKNKE